MPVNVLYIALKNENAKNRANTIIGGAPAHRPMIASNTVHSHCGGTVSTRRPTLSTNSTVSTTAAAANADSPTPPASPPPSPYFCSRGSANVAIAKYGVTAQNQNPAVNSVARQYCLENSIPKLPVRVSSCSTSVISAKLSIYLCAMPCASSRRPTFHSQRGDSGSPIRAMSNTTAIAVLVPRMTRQPMSVFSVSRYPTKNATMNPTYQAINVTPISRPRSRAGANSDKSGQPTEYSAPIATPINSRATNSCQAESTKNCIA